MTQDEFSSLIARVTAQIAGKPLDAELKLFLDANIPAAGDLFLQVEAACKEAVAAGWMCNREAGGIKFGRVIKPGEATHGFSVDVVEMNDCKGPHHRHPHGEIDMIMPIDEGACFDSQPRGWCVYGADSAHFPTVSGGRAYVLYLLPQGAIEFSK